MSHIVNFDASPKQLSKLRNGHRVRIKKGEGFNVIVHPGTYNLINKAFEKNRGVEIALSPEEIEINRALSPEAHMAYKKANPEIKGEGIFGKKFDKMLKKAGIKKLAYSIGDQIKPLAKAGITAGLASGATALGAVQPELVPFLPAGVAGLSSLAYDYLDNPDKYQRGFSGIKGKPVRSLAEQAVKARMNEKLNEHLGTNYDYMSRAGLENAMAQKANAELNKASVIPRFIQPPSSRGATEGMGLGTGLYASGRSGGRIRDRSIMGRGNLNSEMYYPPALASQPLGANFQFQHFLPPAYQRFNSGSGLYA